MSKEHRENLGTRHSVKLPAARFLDADSIVCSRAVACSQASQLDALLVHPPASNGRIWTLGCGA